MAVRGRGRKMITFAMETVGINRGENAPLSVQQPMPLFPLLEQKPLPLIGGEEMDYLLALKQELRGAMKTLPCFIQPATPHRDWKRLPKELRAPLKRPSRDVIREQSHPKKKKSVLQKEEVLLKLETLEKKEEERGNSGEEQQEEEEEREEKKKKQEEEEAEGEEEYDEEEFEEETDYIMSYFDNGEEFGGDSDDNMEEAIY
ncbi:RNA polymerase III subunit GL b isoform X2 [Takifugu flavidus]|uniref:RNA polymerase III subunit GL b isoform X2 n=1 Tax=Takifugu flavidus TaxID=433684 RepID=UPI0025441507|nr:RNA polymerase III subunit GL b isoform X2 [Takifugu flavidus]